MIFFNYCRIILQQVKLNNRIIAIVGLIMSIASCALIADWQSIPFDHCTDFSLYHHPELLLENNQSSSTYTTNLLNLRTHRMMANHFEQEYNTSIYDKKMTCSIVANAQNICDVRSKKCLNVQYSPGSIIEVSNYPCETISSDHDTNEYLCNWNQTVTFCLHINKTSDYEHNNLPYFASVQYLAKDNGLMEQCTQTQVKGETCHWTANSLITQRYCSDCQPICRSPSHSLNFVQFSVGAALLMLSIPIAWIPVASMASERTEKELQVHVIYV